MTKFNCFPRGTSELLGHYTSVTVAIEHILQENIIRFSPLRYMNDPRENKERGIGVAWSGRDEKFPRGFGSVQKRLRERHLDYSKVFSGTIDAADNPFNLGTKACFGRPRMWAQYGDRHRGVCLIFHLAILGQEIKNYLDDDAVFFSGSISYLDDLKEDSANALDFDYDPVAQIGLDAALLGHIKNHKDALFLRKDSDWIGESEWRYVIYCLRKGYEYVPFEKSLKAIVMGVDCSEAYIPALQALCGEVPILQLVWDHQKEDFRFKQD